MIADGNGHTIFDNVMKPGDTYAVPDKPGLMLTTGNGAGLILTLDGKELPRLSTSASKMLHNIPLNAATLKNLKTR